MAAAVRLFSWLSSSALGSGWAGSQIEVTRTAPSPATFSRSSFAFASVSVPAFTSSSAAPTIIDGPPACAAGATRSAVAAAAAVSRPLIVATIA